MDKQNCSRLRPILALCARRTRRRTTEHGLLRSAPGPCRDRRAEQRRTLEYSKWKVFKEALERLAKATRRQGVVDAFQFVSVPAIEYPAGRATIIARLAPWH